MGRMAFYAGVGDGGIGNDNASWATCHAATSGVSAEPTQALSSLVARSNSGTSFSIARAYFPINTALLTDKTITSANFYLHIHTVFTNNGSKQFVLVQTDQASNTTLGTADFNNCGTETNPTEGAARVNIAAGWLKFVMNATGLSWIVQNGFTKLGVRVDLDADNSTPVDGSSEVDTTFDTTESSSQPYLEVFYQSVNGISINRLRPRPFGPGLAR